MHYIINNTLSINHTHSQKVIIMWPAALSQTPQGHCPEPLSTKILLYALYIVLLSTNLELGSQHWFLLRQFSTEVVRETESTKTQRSTVESSAGDQWPLLINHEPGEYNWLKSQKKSLNCCGTRSLQSGIIYREKDSGQAVKWVSQVRKSTLLANFEDSKLTFPRVYMVQTLQGLSTN